MKPLVVDILIPTYNRKRLIQASIEQALKQTYPYLNIVVSDNCSDDGTEDVVRPLLSKYSNLYFYKNHVNHGVYGNYNIALRQYCKGDYVLVLSDDDLLVDVNYIADAIKLVQKNNLAWISAGYSILDVNKKIMKSYVRDIDFYGTGKEFLQIHKWGYDNFCWLCTLMDRQKLLDYGEFSADLYNADYHVLFGMSVDENIAILARNVGVYTMNPFQFNHMLKDEDMFLGYRLYTLIKSQIDDVELKAILDQNIKHYITACFRYFMDRAVFDNMQFNGNYWIDYFKKLDEGRYFPFFDEEAEEKYFLFNRDKEKFREIRGSKFSEQWEAVTSDNLLRFIQYFT